MVKVESRPRMWHQITWRNVTKMVTEESVVFNLKKKALMTGPVDHLRITSLLTIDGVWIMNRGH